VPAYYSAAQWLQAAVLHSGTCRLQCCSVSAGCSTAQWCLQTTVLHSACRLQCCTVPADCIPSLGFRTKLAYLLIWRTFDVRATLKFQRPQRSLDLLISELILGSLLQFQNKYDIACSGHHRMAQNPRNIAGSANSRLTISATCKNSKRSDRLVGHPVLWYWQHSVVIKCYIVLE
jgi:hypothetical protein